MGRELAIKVIHEWSPDKDDARWVQTFMEAVVRAYAAPDDPPDDLRCCAACGCDSEGDVFEKCEGGCGWYCDDCIRHDSEGVPLCPDCYAALPTLNPPVAEPAVVPAPEARRMQANPMNTSDSEHGVEHYETHECAAGHPCQPVTAPVDARPAPPSADEIEGYEITGEYRDPVPGEWVFSKLGDGAIGPVNSNWIAGDSRWILREKPAPWKPKPGDRVRCKMDDLEIIGIVERVDEKMNVKFRYLADKKHCSYCELLEATKEI